MGIQAEYNPDLALRHWDQYTLRRRKKEECIPSDLEEGEVYDFLKKGQRNYWFGGEIPLIETNSGNLSAPLAAIVILEATHYLADGEVYTTGKYRVVKKIAKGEIYFNGFGKVYK
jgi:hypothetical protein